MNVQFSVYSRYPIILYSARVHSLTSARSILHTNELEIMLNHLDWAFGHTYIIREQSIVCSISVVKTQRCMRYLQYSRSIELSSELNLTE